MPGLALLSINNGPFIFSFIHSSNTWRVRTIFCVKIAVAPTYGHLNTGLGTAHTLLIPFSLALRELCTNWTKGLIFWAGTALRQNMSLVKPGSPAGGQLYSPVLQAGTRAPGHDSGSGGVLIGLNPGRQFPRTRPLQERLEFPASPEQRTLGQAEPWTRNFRGCSLGLSEVRGAACA